MRGGTLSIDDSLTSSTYGSGWSNIRLDEKIASIRDYFINSKREIILFLCYFCVVTFSMILTWWSVLQYSARVIGKVHFIILVPLIIACFALFIILIRKHRSCPEKVFLLVGIPALQFFVFFIPPNQVPDEIWHIFRVFDYLLPDGGTTIPLALQYPNDGFPKNYAMLYESIVSQSGWGETVFLPDGLDNYLTHLYFLPGLIVDAAEILNLNPFAAIYLAQSTNALLFLIGGYWIIKILPFGRVMACVYLLNPMLVQQESSCSADAMTNLLVLLFISYLIHLLFVKQLSIIQIVALVVLSILACLSKIAYAPLLLLWLLLLNKISNPKVKNTIFITVCALLLTGIAIILFFYNGDQYKESFELVRNFPDFIRVMFNTGNEMVALWIKETFGMILGYLNIVIWEPCFWAYALMLLFSAVFNLGESKSFSRAQKIVVICIVVLVTIPLILVFRQWTLEVDQRSDVIMGVQGRYFIPYFLLPLLCLISSKAILVRKNILITFSIVFVFVYLIDAFTIMHAFI